MRAISLLYHDVVEAERPDESGFPGPASARYKLSVPEFREHLAAIATALTGPPVLVTDLPASNGNALPRLLTVDDGGASALRIADLLEEKGWRAHFFVTTDYIGTPSFLDASRIRELRRRGHAIGSHSCSHPERMSRLGRDELRREWNRSLQTLSEILGEAVGIASVPGGYYARGVAEAAAEAGVRALFTSEPTTRCSRVEDCLVLGRYTLWRGMTAGAAGAFAAGLLKPRVRQWLAWNSKKAAKNLAGKHYLTLRRRLVGPS